MEGGGGLLAPSVTLRQIAQYIVYLSVKWLGQFILLHEGKKKIEVKYFLQVNIVQGQQHRLKQSSLV